jgi:hypothetical protein
LAAIRGHATPSALQPDATALLAEGSKRRVKSAVSLRVSITGSDVVVT